MTEEALSEEDDIESAPREQPKPLVPSPGTASGGLPTGTVTFLFTDIQGSTKLWQAHGDVMPGVLARHDGLLRAAIERNGGVVFGSGGDGLYAAFTTAPAALAAALAAQQTLRAERWEEGIVIAVRMALHTGTAEVRDGNYVGHTLNRVARLLSAGHGGQVLLSEVTQELVSDGLPAEVELRDLGTHRLKDLLRPEHIYQVGTADLPREFAPLITREVRRTNLPRENTPFIGREGDVRSVLDLLLREGVNLVTLTGPGGTGKTRLALRVAAAAIDRFADGVVFVPLASAADPSQVAGTIATAIEAEDDANASPEEMLKAALRGKEMLLVLDNFEHLLGAEPLVADLLAVPGLKILVTSRTLLQISAEHEYAVPPLRVPDPRHLPELVDLSQYDAVNLFIQRARAVKTDFAVTNANAAAVAEICARLDGLPLAIELAAARIRLFPPHALLRRLESRLQILTGGARDLPARQQTLRAALDWSYQLLRPEEQRLFELVSVFSGITLEAAEAVAGAVDAEVGGVDALEGLTSLAHNSLIRQAGTGEEEPRFVMLATIREYAAERLSARPDLSAAARRAHAAYYGDFAGARWEVLGGAGREEAITALEAEGENLRIAWEYWLRERELDQLTTLIDPLWFLYDRRGWHRAAVELANGLLEILSTAPPTPERRAQELTLRTGIARTLLALHGFTAEVEQAYARALEGVGEDRKLPQLFPVLRGLYSLRNYRAEFEQAEQAGREIIRLAEVQHNPSMRADGEFRVGSIVMVKSDLHEGLRYIDAAIDTFESEGYIAPRHGLGPFPEVSALAVSALALWLLGFPDGALERAERAVARATRLEHPLTVAYALYHTGFLHLWRREPQRVRERALELLTVAGDHELPLWRALGRFLLGAAKPELGRVDEGMADMADGIAQYQGLKTPPVFWPLLLYVRAGAAVRAGKPEEGLRWIDEAIAIAGTEWTLAPEFLLTKGDLLLAAGDFGGAEEWFSRAHQGASQANARMSQLRAALGLARVQPKRRDEGSGYGLLRSAYATFTEGFTTLDLIEAKSVLDGVS